jgi:predicted transcriptional regulator
MATPRKVSDAELEVLKALWDDGPRTIRQLTDRLYPEGGAAHYATVQKLLERLEGKSCVRSRRRPGRPNLYLAVVERRQLIADLLRDTANRLCGGSLTPLLTHLVGHAELDADELAELRALVVSAETRWRRRGPA